jgi:hypothetical protein
MVLPLVPQVQATVSADETIGLVQHLRGNRDSQGFCAFGLNEQTRTPNAQAEARATGTDTRAGKKRTLWPVASSATLGAWEGRDTVLTYPFYPFNSFFSSLRKRQSVPCSMSFCGVLLIMPASWRRRA